MTDTLHDSAGVGTAVSLRLLRDILEEQFAIHTNRLTELVVCGALPQRGGHDPRTLAALTEESRQALADAAHALQRMSQGDYGICEACRRSIPLGRLHALPAARFCVPCHQAQPVRYM